MNFREKLTLIMKERAINQVELSRITGIGKPSLSQYMNGTHEPSAQRRRQIATALNLPENYFESIDAETTLSSKEDCVNVPVNLAAKLMGKSPKWVMQGLQDGRLPWGYAVKLKRWDYWISPVKFSEDTGIKIQFNDIFKEIKTLNMQTAETREEQL